MSNNDLHILDQQGSIKEFLIHKRLNGTLWTKLFKSSMFDGIHFDTALNCYEDTDVMWRLLHKINRLVLVNEAKYNWIISNTSLSNGAVNRKRLESCIRLFSKMKNDVRTSGETEYSDLVDSMCQRWFYGSIKQMFKFDACYPDIEEAMLNELRKRPVKAMQAQGHLTDALFACVLMLLPSLSRRIYKHLTK